MTIEFSDFLDEIRTESAILGDVPSEVFYRKYAEVAVDRGDCPELDHRPLRGKDKTGKDFRLDGYSIEIQEAEKGKELVIVYAAACFFEQDADDPLIVRAAEMDEYVAQIKRAISHITDPAYRNIGLADHYDAEAADFGARVFENVESKSVSHFKFLVFTNNVYETRRKSHKETQIFGIGSKSVVLDWDDYNEFTHTGANPIKIEFQEYGGSEKGVPCIKTAENDQLTSYLLAINAETIADLMEEYDSRLLESNVRTYLEARTKTNKGILKTIKETPQLFFAYNNGITATAREAEFHQDLNSLYLLSLTDLQLVNGGQTSSSLLYAREQNKDSLDGIKVQMKLNVLKDDASQEEIVPNISRFSNTQNPVSDADLVANEKFQTEIERLFNEFKIPALDRIVVPRWFYERARGAYKSLFRYKTDAQRRENKERYPSDMVITKTDAAKYFLLGEGKPWFVAQGGNKALREFTKIVAGAYEKNDGYLNDLWAKDLVSKAIMYRQLDSSIGKSDWYKADRGYKAQIVTYTIAFVVEYFARNEMLIDYGKIWDAQKVNVNLLTFMTAIGESIGYILKDPPPQVRNISEFAKRKFCSDHVYALLDKYEHEELQMLQKFGVSKSEALARAKEEKGKQSDINDMGLWQNLLSRSGETPQLADFLRRTDRYQNKIGKALSRLYSGNYQEGDGKILNEAFDAYDNS